MAKYKLDTTLSVNHVYIMNVNTLATHFTYHPVKIRNGTYREIDRWSVPTGEEDIFARANIEGPLCWGQVKKRLRELGYNITRTPEVDNNG